MILFGQLWIVLTFGDLPKANIIYDARVHSNRHVSTPKVADFGKIQARNHFMEHSHVAIFHK